MQVFARMASVSGERGVERPPLQRPLGAAAARGPAVRAGIGGVRRLLEELPEWLPVLDVLQRQRGERDVADDRGRWPADEGVASARRELPWLCGAVLHIEPVPVPGVGLPGVPVPGEVDEHLVVGGVGRRRVHRAPRRPPLLLAPLPLVRGQQVPGVVWKQVPRHVERGPPLRSVFGACYAGPSAGHAVHGVTRGRDALLLRRHAGFLVRPRRRDDELRHQRLRGQDLLSVRILVGVQRIDVERRRELVEHRDHPCGVTCLRTDQRLPLPGLEFILLGLHGPTDLAELLLRRREGLPERRDPILVLLRLGTSFFRKSVCRREFIGDIDALVRATG
mmetsp:Transcript_65518/g.184512  ORF Transcript_65518/g.184512 Transcript_65518/m.184512 type:complete len:335 (-) Transcript_65518:718-1722(-)